MKTVFVIDDVIDKEIQDLIEDTLLGSTFAWWKNDDITYPTLTERKTPKRGATFSAKIMDPTSNYYNHDVIRLCHHILEGVCDELNIKDMAVTQTRAFLHIAQPKFLWNRKDTKHTDQDDPHTVILYYVNDSDGPTDLFNEKGRVMRSIKPKKGRCVVFDGSIPHRSTHSKHRDRCIVNFNVT